MIFSFNHFKKLGLSQFIHMTSFLLKGCIALLETKDYSGIDLYFILFS